MLSFWWFPLVLFFPSLSVFVLVLWWLRYSTNYNWYHCHLHVAQFFNSLTSSRYLLFFSLSFNLLWSARRAKSTIRQVLFFFFFFWLLLSLVIWPRLDDRFVSQNSRGICSSHSPGQILGCAYNICSHGQIEASCTVSKGSPRPPSRV